MASLLEEIAYCPNVDVARVNTAHPCHLIVTSQKPDHSFQIPEPWIGHLDRAHILFISSNPSISDAEDYPTAEWTRERAMRFFSHRFEEWVEDGCYCKVKEGKDPGPRRPTRYWVWAKARAEELLGGPAQPGIDYCLTEIVHCKSHEEIGVRDAAEECAERYLKDILDVSAALVVVVVGKHAAKAVRQLLHSDGGASTWTPSDGREVDFLFVPHPAAFGAKRFCDTAKEQLPLIRRRLSEQSPVSPEESELR